ncbi:GrpE domain chaperone [Schizosaccharomyces japonicus yFS275]|uniref:GrpE protein homolog n=1 Tax=Schizosaccharomyces japonicus (strain yFS275 / FY16936) TaxID=402676 RepID=B6K5N8_SCHJY|nr:GrpE domain chaperone [Schizosaccharomyces japonicus yFS275]EEB08842.1 GrpE domain chaperone [Schizosaccharomyces japonicus yFS275]
MLRLKQFVRPSVFRCLRPQFSAGALRYSTETPKKPTEGGVDGSATSAASGSEVEVLKEQVAKKDKEISELKDQFLRQVADYRNLEKRVERETKQARDFALQKLAKDLLESLDNLERALEIVPEEMRNDTKNHSELAELYKGLSMTEEILMKTLNKHGLKRYDGVGEHFNPNLHEAVFFVPVPDKEPNTVFHCESKGFDLNGRVIRPAKVGVVKGPE